jgi:hypothetical protein
LITDARVAEHKDQNVPVDVDAGAMSSPDFMHDMPCYLGCRGLTVDTGFDRCMNLGYMRTRTVTMTEFSVDVESDFVVLSVSSIVFC